MVNVVVVGAGIGAMAAAARLAKLGHRVTVCERNRAAGGMVRRIECDGFAWDAGPASTSLPAVFRDLFRKSGRPLEQYVELAMRPIARRHVFVDGSQVDLPTGSRAAQTAAVDAGLGAGQGAAWTAFVDRLGITWQALRGQALDPPDGGLRLGERAVAAELGSSTSMARLLKRSLSDERLRLMAAEPLTRAGSDPRRVPSFAAVTSYIERSFGVWGAPGGMAELTAALVTRLAERRVEVRYDSEVRAITVRGGRVAGVTTSDGACLAADVVVAGIDARVALGSLLPRGAAPQAARRFAASAPAALPAVTHLGLMGEDPPPLPEEVVFHGAPSLVLTTAGSAPEGGRAWTVEMPGAEGADALAALRSHGLDIRAQVVVRIDRAPADLLNETGGSSYGTAWDGWRANARRAALVNPVEGLYLVGASVHPGSSIAYAAWGAAHVAARVGKAERQG